MTIEKGDKVIYNVITEQGDLGLGASVLNEADQKVVSEQVEAEKSKKKKEPKEEK